MYLCYNAFMSDPLYNGIASGRLSEIELDGFIFRAYEVVDDRFFYYMAEKDDGQFLYEASLYFTILNQGLSVDDHENIEYVRDAITFHKETIYDLLLDCTDAMEDTRVDWVMRHRGYIESMG